MAYVCILLVCGHFFTSPSHFALAPMGIGASTAGRCLTFNSIKIHHLLPLRLAAVEVGFFHTRGGWRGCVECVWPVAHQTYAWAPPGSNEGGWVGVRCARTRQTPLRPRSAAVRAHDGPPLAFRPSHMFLTCSCFQPFLATPPPSIDRRPIEPIIWDRSDRTHT